MPRVNIAEVRSEELLTELLTAQGWDVRRPPNGNLLRQHEYRSHPHLVELFRGRSKSGGSGFGLPEAVLVDQESLEPLAVVEAKARRDQILAAEQEAKHYGRACIEAGCLSLAIAVAGNSADGFAVSIFKWKGDRWVAVTYEGRPIGWIPNRKDLERLRPPTAPVELRPSVPPNEVLFAYADEINRLLRESGIKDEYRPAVVAAIMLALWRSKGDIRRSQEHILQDINQACGQAFWKANKPKLHQSLRVDEANKALALKARRIVSILEQLNVTVLTAEHDYLGELYERFFQYTGGNTIGQYFTPRHIAAFMTDLVETDSEDIILDPACGTGGFLIAAMQRVHRQRKLSRGQVIKLVGDRLIGFEKEPVTAALCVANMILRGDGSTGIHDADVFSSPEFPVEKATVVLTNPPFPHKKTDTPPEDFLFRGLEALGQRGRAAAIIPTSYLVKGDKRGWRVDLLVNNTVEAVIGLPDDLFEPFASSYAGIVIVTKGVSHPVSKSVFFARITHDGFDVQKRVKVPVPGEQLTAVLDAYKNHVRIPGLCGWAPIDQESLVYGPGLYVPARPLSRAELIVEIGELIRRRTAFAARYATELVRLGEIVARGGVHVKRQAKRARDYREATNGCTIADKFTINYGQRALHSKRDLEPGSSLIISSSGTENGCYGFFDFIDLLEPPFVTVPSTGSIGHAHVQEWPCGVTDDCLILRAREGVPHSLLYVAAAVVRCERWRFSYGMKITPERIADYPLPVDDKLLLEEVDTLLSASARIEALALEAARHELDARAASAEEGEFGAFEALARKLVRVPKAELAKKVKK